MTVERVIDRLVGLINPDNAEEENQALEEAVKVLKQYNRLVQVKVRPVKQHIKIQYEGEELTIKELVGKLEYYKEGQEYLKWVVVEREKEIALLKKQLADARRCDTGGAKMDEKDTNVPTNF